MTWKFSDLCAFVATEAAVLPSMLQILVAGKRMFPEEYVLSIPELHFQAESVVMDMEFSKEGIQPEIAELKKPIQSDEGSLFHPGVVRFTVRNPKWGTVRSCAVSKDVLHRRSDQQVAAGFHVTDTASHVLQ